MRTRLISENPLKLLLSVLHLFFLDKRYAHILYYMDLYHKTCSVVDLGVSEPGARSRPGRILGVDCFDAPSRIPYVFFSESR